MRDVSEGRRIKAHPATRRSLDAPGRLGSLADDCLFRTCSVRSALSDIGRKAFGHAFLEAQLTENRQRSRESQGFLHTRVIGSLRRLVNFVRSAHMSNAHVFSLPGVSRVYQYGNI